MSPSTAPRRRRGRRRRIAAEAQAAPAIIAGTRRQIPPYEMIGEEGLDLIERRADDILKEIGVEFQGDEAALDLWRAAGADVKGQRVRFDPGHVRHLVQATTPKQFIQHARNPARSLTIGGDSVVFAPMYGAPFVQDLDRGRRYGTLEDFQDLVKLTYATPWLHHSGGTVCEPVDVAVNKRHLDMVYAHMRYSDMPFMGSVTAPERAEDSIAMARLLFGDEVVDRDCVIMGNINMNSPLVYDAAMSRSLRAYARANQCPIVVPFVLAGATAPVTMAAAIAQSLAEVMVGVALGQLERPGSPAVFGNFVTTVNLRAGTPTFGTPEASLASFAVGQLARRFGVPLRCSGAFTSAKTADAQAMQESVNGLMTAVLCGANFVLHGAGWLESGLSVGLEKFVLDADYLGALHTLMKGVSLDDDAFALDAFHEIGPGNHFFGAAHTLRHYESAFYEAGLSDSNSFEQWTEDGAKNAEVRANAKWKRRLADYEAPPLDAGLDEALLGFMEKKKEELPDIWH